MLAKSSFRQTADIVADIEHYVTQYVTFTNADHAFVAALWSIATHLWPLFDAFPYMVITSPTKRSGKTRFSEVLSFVASNPFNAAGTGPASLFRIVQTMKPTIILDEAEDLNKESASVMRSFLNVGYRKGQVIPRVQGNKVVTYDAYCPKVFVLIGDVYDTLRDRSVIVRMQRAEPKVRFVREIAESEGHTLRNRVAAMAGDVQVDVQSTYQNHGGLDFLQDRDEEIWLPLFAVCAAFCPSRLDQLKQVATDLSVEKTQDAHSYIASADAEKAAENEEYAKRLIDDLLQLIDGRKSIFTAEAVDQLKAIPTAPWRKFRGDDGLNAIIMAQLLEPHHVEPTLIRVGGKGPNAQVKRGYRREDLEAARAQMK